VTALTEVSAKRPGRSVLTPVPVRRRYNGEHLACPSHCFLGRAAANQGTTIDSRCSTLLAKARAGERRYRNPILPPRLHITGVNASPANPDGCGSTRAPRPRLA